MKKNIVLVLIAITFFISNFSFAQTTSYVDEYKGLAKSLSLEFGIPTSIILSIAIVESGAGSSKVAKKLNNHFGIKGKNDVTWSSFKQYTSPEESFRDFCLKMASKKFYLNMKGNEDYVLWIKKISSTGYSTQPTQWRSKINKTIKKNKLDSQQ